MEYPVLLHKTDSGYTAVCPRFPACNAQGATADEALENVRDAIIDFTTVREGLRWHDVLDSDDITEVEVEQQKEIVLQYRIRMIKHSDGFSVSCPMLPGCHSQGDTMDEALANIQIAIREWLVSAQEILLLGEPDVEVVEVGDEDEVAV